MIDAGINSHDRLFIITTATAIIIILYPSIRHIWYHSPSPSSSYSTGIKIQVYTAQIDLESTIIVERWIYRSLGQPSFQSRDRSPEQYTFL